MENYDFSGWATKANLKCSDGRTIMKDAFIHNDGQTVPLVWNHGHNDVGNILGHALLENRPEGVYMYGTFNETEAGKDAKLLVEHGDIKSLSIYANQLKEQGKNVIHGAIREVSLVLAGANLGAYIDTVVQHGEELEHDDESEEAIIYNLEQDTEIELTHADNVSTEPVIDIVEEEEIPVVHAESPAPASTEEPEETIGDIIATMNEKQKNVLYSLVAKVTEESAIEHSEPEDTSATEETAEPEDTSDVKSTEEIEGGDTIMKHNLFAIDPANPTAEGKVLSHSDMEAVIKDARRLGTMSAAVLEHGITNVDYLFPDAVNLDKTPSFIAREMTWVSDVMAGVHKTPFSRIKSMHADITGDDARAKGYLKGGLKTEEVFSLLKRTTTPTTIYKKQKMDRDDVVDITDFDVIAWLKSEMRVMLDEEIARAILVGDGRLSSSDDKVKEDNLRPIWTDADLYTIKTVVAVATADAAKTEVIAKAFIRAVIKSRKGYKGSGSPTLYTTEDILTDCLLIEDTTGRVIYDSVEKLAITLRVKKIVTVPVMEDLTRVVETVTRTLMGIVVNLNDYNLGADKGGAVNMFDDFDIDYNAQKYLIETRASGALTVPFSAIALEKVVS